MCVELCNIYRYTFSESEPDDDDDEDEEDEEDDDEEDFLSFGFSSPLESDSSLDDSSEELTDVLYVDGVFVSIRLRILFWMPMWHY